ncbi:MAG: pentapeptide repeat-containing protein [Candidatus Halichondribacter symbioticus]
MMINFWFFAIIFGALFLLGKAVWQDFESFAPWKQWLKKLCTGRWKWFRSFPALKQTYIIVAGAIGLALLVLFVVLYLQIITIPFNPSKLDGSELRNLAIAFIGTITGIGALFGVYLAILKSETTERQTYTEEQGLITDRLNKATEGLGKKDGDNPLIEVRLGALYALERIAKDSERDHIRIMKIFCAYIRHNSPLKSKNAKPKKLREDIQAALTIIGRRDVWNDAIKRLDNEHLEGFYIDLSNCDLYGAQLSKVEMSWANFSGTNLENATISWATLDHARFENTNLTNTSLHETSLQNTFFNETNMSDAFLAIINIKDARIYNTNMSRANLSSVNMGIKWTAYINMHDAMTSYAYAYKGDFSTYTNLTQKQLNVMFCGIGVKIPSKLKRPKHWPKDKLLYKEFESARIKWRDKDTK